MRTKSQIFWAEPDDDYAGGGGGKWMCSLSDVKEKKFFAGENFKHGVYI